MPRPLPESERRRFIERALALGVPPERIRSDLAQLEGYEPLSAAIDPSQALTTAGLAGGGPPVTSEEQAAGMEFFTKDLPGFVVPAATSAIGGFVGGIPGMMGGSALGEMILGTEIEPREGRIPRIGLREGTAGRAIQSALLTGATSKLANLGIRGAGYLAGVKQRAITPVLRKGPIGTLRAISEPAELAERQAATAALAATSKTAPALAQAEAALSDLDARMLALHARPSRRIIIDKINDMLKARGIPANPEEAAANKSLEKFKAFVPEFENATKLHDWLTRIRVPIKEQLGKAGAPIHKDDLIELQQFVRSYRDQLLGGPKSVGAEAFATASRQIQAAKDLRKMFVDNRGNLKPGAEGMWRRALSKKNHAFRQALESFDNLTGQNLTAKAEELALRRMWNVEDETNAVFVLSIIARAVRMVARGAAKTGALIRPAVGPTTAGMIGLTGAEERRIGPNP